MTMKCLAVALGLGLSGVHVATADPVMECSFDGGSQVETGNCLGKVEEAVEAALQLALEFAGNAANELDGVTEREMSFPALQASQKAWLSYRNDHCDFVGTTFGGGSGTGIAITACRIGLARARTDQLMKYAQ